MNVIQTDRGRETATFRRLRLWNLGAGISHLVQGLLMILLASSWTIPVTTNYAVSETAGPPAGKWRRSSDICVWDRDLPVLLLQHLRPQHGSAVQAMGQVEELSLRGEGLQHPRSNRQGFTGMVGIRRHVRLDFVES
jgi:hypothetical protein